MAWVSESRPTPRSCRFPPRGSTASVSEPPLPDLPLPGEGQPASREREAKSCSSGSTRHWRGTRQLGKPSTKPCDDEEPKVVQNIIAPVGHCCPSSLVLELESYSLSGLLRRAHSGVKSHMKAQVAPLHRTQPKPTYSTSLSRWDSALYL